MIETIGWIGNILFAICGLPQAIKTWRSKKVDDLSSLFLWLWLLGELFTFIYIIAVDIKDHTSHFPLYFNYVFNFCLASYLVWAKLKYPHKYPTSKE